MLRPSVKCHGLMRRVLRGLIVPEASGRSYPVREMTYPGPKAGMAEGRTAKS